MTILCSDVVGLSSNYPRIVFLLAEAFGELALKSGAFQISWQAHYLVRLQGDFTCSTHWKWRFIRDADQWWHWFCVAGAVFGDVGGRLLLAPRSGNDVSYVARISHQIHFAWQAQYLVRLEGDFSWQARHFLTFWEIAGARNVVFYNNKIVSKMGRVRSPKRRVRDDDFVFGCGRIILELSSNRLSIGGSIQGVSAEIWRFQISWQAHYLVRLQGDLIGSAHWKWRFICDAHHRGHSFCVAGAVFGDVGGWLDWLRALEMTFHMRCGWRMPFILRGRRSICWVWSVTLLAPRNGNYVSDVMRMKDAFHLSICWVWMVTLLAPRNGNDVPYVLLYFGRSRKCISSPGWDSEAPGEKYFVVESSTSSGVVLCRGIPAAPCSPGK